MRRFWYFDVSVWSVDRKPYHSRLCQNSVFTPYCKDWEPVYPPNIFKRLQFPWIPLRYPQTPLRLLPDTPQISPVNMECQQTTTDAKKHCQTFSNSTCQFLGVFGDVCWRLVAYVGMLCSTEMLWGYRGNVWGVFGWIWVEFMEIGGAQMCLGGIWVLKPCSMEWKHYFGTAQNGTVFCQLTILRPQITKMAACKLSKNDWVMPFFVIIRFTREKLLVTVSFDHPVSHLRALGVCLFSSQIV